MATCISWDATEPRNFDLALLGYTKELSIKGLRQLAENNKEQIKEFRNRSYDCELLLTDGTRIKAIGYSENYLRGYKFDQIILFDDDRWLIETDKAEFIRMLKLGAMYVSNVPEEYQILYYEDI